MDQRILSPIVAQLLALAVGPPVGAGPVAQGGHGFQRHVAGALDRPFVVLLHQDRSDEGDDGVVVGKDSEDLGPSFDIASEPFETGAELRLRGVGPVAYGATIRDRGGGGTKVWAGRSIP